MEFCFFGVEIEVIVKPHKVRSPLDPALYYQKLAASLQKRGQQARADKLDEQRYRKYPEHYDKLWITRDGSLGHPSIDRSKLSFLDAGNSNHNGSNPLGLSLTVCQQFL